MPSVKLFSALIILSITLISGLYPFFKKMTSKENFQFPVGEALSCGVFLGAGLMHMLGDACHQFYAQHVNYPVAFLLAGLTFLLLLLLEHVGKEIYSHEGSSNTAFPILATIMLSIHSFLAGTALGLSSSLAITMMILLAIVAHKWAASFSLAVQITKSPLRLRSGIVLFVIFSLMAPLGVVFGQAISDSLVHLPLLAPSLMAMAAGTFIYLGALHGLDRAVLVQQCCNLKLFYFVIAGFMIMAVVATWT